MTANGKVDDLRLRSSGSAAVDLQKLPAKTANVELRGSGDADIAVENDLKITISGSATVRLHGHPRQIHSRVSGSGKIEDLP
ncbi:MAG: DUF2807 domain-containing protein [Azospirillaceae bacterium]|nr:DUF2807 domain-containing protein [Azospirillaceae bacterium]